jgi:hypothetical protein
MLAAHALALYSGSPDATMQWAPDGRAAFPDLFLHVGLFFVLMASTRPGAERPLFECGSWLHSTPLQHTHHCQHVVRGVSCLPSDLRHLLILE